MPPFRAQFVAKVRQLAHCVVRRGEVSDLYDCVWEQQHQGGSDSGGGGDADAAAAAAAAAAAGLTTTLLVPYLRESMRARRRLRELHLQQQQQQQQQQQDASLEALQWQQQLDWYAALICAVRAMLPVLLFIVSSNHPPPLTRVFSSLC